MTAAGRRAAITLALAVGIVLVVMLGVRMLADHLPPPHGAWGVAASETGITIALSGTLLLVGLAGMRGGPVPHSRMPPGPAAAIGLGIGVGGLFTAFLLAMLAGVGSRGHGTTSALLALLGTLVVALQAAGEEIYFRGWLLTRLEHAWGAMPALIVSAVAFGALHLAGGARAPLSLVNLVAGGLLFGLLAQRTGGLIAPIAAHWGWNWAEGVALGLDPNPGSGSFGAIRDYDLLGAAVWGGSPEGMNASLAMTAVLVALILPLAVWPGRLSRSAANG